jgi:5-methylcytosine-specific restriction endonuclease McrA
MRELHKANPMRLTSRDYMKLRETILLRDRWRCQSCGAMSELEVHHQQFRSHSGEDKEENLITVCYRCHSAAHRG